MTININNLGVNNNTLSSNNRASESSRNQSTESATTATSSSTSGDSVAISQQALNLTGLEARINDAPAVDTARVDSIRQAIEDGSYSIDADNIADRLLDSDALY